MISPFMEYLEFKPAPPLAKYVECYWSAYSTKPPFREKESLIPDGTIELMFNFGDDYAQVINDKKITVKGSHVIGIRKRSLTISQSGKQNFFCIRFKLGGLYPFFKIPVHLFSNGFYTLQELVGQELRELEEQLYEADTHLTRISLTNHYLLKKLRDKIDDYTFVEKCVPHLVKTMDIKTVADNFGAGYKTMERRFQRVLGLSPSEVIKINRFNRAVLSMYSCNFNSLTSIAHACGYYDQSHFIREFKQLTAYTPNEFLKEQFTIVQVIQPALAERMSKSYNF